MNGMIQCLLFYLTSFVQHITSGIYFLLMSEFPQYKYNCLFFHLLKKVELFAKDLEQQNNFVKEKVAGFTLPVLNTQKITVINRVFIGIGILKEMDRCRVQKYELKKFSGDEKYFQKRFLK